jgi:hypothetical protein
LDIKVRDDGVLVCCSCLSIGSASILSRAQVLWTLAGILCVAIGAGYVREYVFLILTPGVGFWLPWYYVSCLVLIMPEGRD